MKKIDSGLLICSAAMSQQLVGIGILPVASNCYESIAGTWEYAGEYVGQQPVIPAWTMEELNILIGGDFPQVIFRNEKNGGMIVKYPKPDLYRAQDWTRDANMMKFILRFPHKRIETFNAAEAYAILLYELILIKELNVEDCNARLEAFAEKDRVFNPITNRLEQEAKKKY